MLWKELEDRIYKILKNIDLTDREKAELILIEFNQYEPTAKTLKEDTQLHKEYEKYINHTKEGALRLIADLAVGYDGYNTVESLKKLVDELRAVALLGLKQEK